MVQSSSSPTASPDVEYFAFTERGPWTIDPAQIRWLSGLAALRATTQAEVPELLRRRAVPPLGRFLETAYRIGGALLGWRFNERAQGGAMSRAGISRRLRQAAEPLGPAYIKLGQVLSSGKGLFPDELVDEFKQLRDQVKPEPFAVVRQTVEEDLGRSLDSVFSSFDRDCLASASIAQVHAATLRTGENVVVKVQRPRVAKAVRQDIRAMAWIAPHLVGRIPVSALANPPALVELFAETIIEELDFRLEAENMLDIARILGESGQRIIVVPRPHPQLVTKRVLVMERLAGFTYQDVEAMKAAGIDTTAMLQALIISFLEGAMIHGVFHGDLHGGNLFVMPEGRIALFDYGITARMDESRRLAFLRLMMLGAANDIRGQLAAYRDLGALAPDADIEAIIRTLKLDQPVVDPTKLTSEQLAHEIQHVTKALIGYGAKLPKPLMVFVKNMLFIDDAIAHLAPEINLFEQVVQIYTYFAETHGERMAAESGLDRSQSGLDLRGFKASIGLSNDVESLTHRDLQRRREIIRARLDEARERPRA
jgi:ubiquinone biosynthesis protein